MLLKEDFNTHLYAEIINTISRDDANLLDEAIEAAEGQAKGYLSRYNIDALFDAVEDARDKVLLMYLKDIAVWHFIVVANPDTDIEYRESRYKAAIKELEKIQNGKVVPYGWELASEEAADSSILVTSVPKRETSF